jgi:nucleotide-binding universal stress UspA family protein
LGSVAERVIQETPVPVFLVRPHSVAPTGDELRILVPLDGSPLSEEALTSANEIAQRSHAQIVLLHALFAPIGEGMRLLFDSQEEVDEMLEQWRLDGEAYLETTAAGVRAKGVNVKTLLAEGMPDEVIENEVVREQIGLVVMSTHGRTGVRRWVYGSVANKVLHAIDCPLLLVRAKGEATSDNGKRVTEARIVPKTPIRVL